MEFFDCPVCIEPINVADAYNINCESTVLHRMCNSCEATWRLKMEITVHGRRLKCPLCRKEERVPGDRSKSSLQMELNSVYAQLSLRVPNPSSLEGIVMGVLQTPMMRPVVERFQLLREQREAQNARNAADTARLFAVQNARAAETARLLESRIVVPQVPQVRQVRQRVWCQSGRRETGQCSTKSRTTRKCSSNGCMRNVCRSCTVCCSH